MMMSETLTKGLELAEYRMVREKAERHLQTMQGTEKVPAEWLLELLYHENV
ncbi:MAG: hypothetical protein IKP43_12330 [Bacteroidaceae bacterium]|nr:hypothetical protein [Bacteroidaceae bacterium]